MPFSTPTSLILETLELSNYKNHAAGVYRFHPLLTCITGLNGVGKTNLLDAIYLLALTKSRFQKSDADLMAHGQEYYRVAGTLLGTEKPLRISIACRRGERKILKVNSEVLPRLADHIGQIPVVFINPDDTPLVRGGAEERRAFFDNLLGQSSPAYLQALMLQNRLLQQRNALLAQIAERQHKNAALLDAYDTPLLQCFGTLAQYRSQCLATFLPRFVAYYAQLAQGQEVPTIQYRTEVLADGFAKQYLENRPRDMAAQRTLLGAHRDEFDLLMQIDQEPPQLVRKVGSQGQQKTFPLALKLAMHDYLASQTGRRPLLLLDDIFERLDEQRIAGLLQLIAGGNLGQAFITEATGSRMQRVVEQAGLASTGWLSL